MLEAGGQDAGRVEFLVRSFFSGYELTWPSLVVSCRGREREREREISSYNGTVPVHEDAMLMT